MEDIKFCKYCGQPLEKGANFVISAEKVLIQSKVRQQANRKHINRQIL